MNTLRIGNMMLEPGRPKVAVPIVAAYPAEIIEECENIKDLPCDIIEWRADYYFSQIEDMDSQLRDKNVYLDMIKILDDIDYIADGKPVIFTIRSKKQGGCVQLSQEQLSGIYALVAQSQLADLIDVELYDAEGRFNEAWLRQTIDEIHDYNAKIILSHHDFNGMPGPGKLVDTVKLMYALGADLCKVAAMATDKNDAEDLLKATSFLSKNNVGPLVMLAMGDAGISTRVVGGRYGSVLTFASAKAASAPGQVDAYTMKNWLDQYYG